MAFLGIKTDTDIESDYCRACKAARKNVDCSSCNKKIDVIEDKEKKTIGRSR